MLFENPPAAATKIFPYAIPPPVLPPPMVGTEEVGTFDETKNGAVTRGRLANPHGKATLPAAGGRFPDL